MTLKTTLQTTLQSAWTRRGPLACLLWPLAQLHAGAVVLRRWLYQQGMLTSWRADVPVIVIGNVVAGGAGKTPLVLALVQHLQAAGRHPGVVSRGYGRQGDGCLEVLPLLPASLCGDEPLLIRQRTGAPVFVARRRIDAVRALLAAHPQTDLILCDDGLQHHALQRDLNIAVFDERGVGNGWLLPAGPLREPWPPIARAKHRSGPQAVAPIDLLLHTGQTAAFAGFQSRRALADNAIAADGTLVPLDSLKGEALTALAAIASPEAFFSMLRQRGLTLARCIPMPDHDKLDAAPLWELGQQGLRALCTEKDAVKLFARYPDAGQQLLAVPLEFKPESGFMQAFDARLNALMTPPAEAT
ncbi:MAG: tetraacyldisaccharide 4'-kinase [Polaromonas sp.]|nr:tetraacyldisaccharide 4'-kinase [Polaromonas sp.]